MLIQADSIHIPLADGSVHCVITSPPYWGLRDYGEECQLGLEPTLEEYIGNMVAVGRELWRVLRDDGTWWLNLGSSYASANSCANQSRSVRSESAYGSDDIERQGSQAIDRACYHCDGARQADCQNHQSHISRIDQEHLADDERPYSKGHDILRSDSAKAYPAVSVPDAQESTIPSSFCYVSGVSSREAKASACQKELLTCADDALVYVHTEQHNSCMSSHHVTSADHKQDTESSSEAYDTPNGLTKNSITTMFQNVKFKRKDLIMIPAMVALALQEDGWYLRSDIIWHKPNPMPESVTDRPTKAHEYLFLLAKRERYYYDADAIKEPVSGNAHSRGDGVNPKACGRRVPAGWDTRPGAHRELVGRYKQNASFSAAVSGTSITMRNKRSVWTIAPAAYNGAHYATFPEALVRPCILAGCPAGGIVFDPFVGSGTTLRVAMQLGRYAIGCDLSFDYLANHAKLRTTNVQLEMCL